MLLGSLNVSAQDDFYGVFNRLGANAGVSTEGLTVGLATPITPYLELGLDANFMPGIKVKGTVNIGAGDIRIPTSSGGVDTYHIDKRNFKVPFVCGARDLGEALRRIAEGASMIRTKGEPGTGDVVQAVRHMRKMNSQIAHVTSLRVDELFEEAKRLQVPYDLLLQVHDTGRLPVVNFAAGGIATPADAALMMQLGAEGVFVGSGIFKSGNPAKRAAAIVQATTNYRDASLIARLSENLGEAMVGINENEIKVIMEERGQ